MYDGYFKKVKNEQKKSDKKILQNQQNYNESHFYEEIKVFVILAKILGALPICKDKTGRLQFKFLSGITIYSLTLLTIIAICSGFLFKHQIHTLQTYDLEFDDQIIFYGALLCLGLYILPLLSFIEGNKIAKYFISWLKFEEKYYKITRKCLNYKMRHLQYITLLIMILTSGFGLYFLSIVTVTQRDKYHVDISIPMQTLFITIYLYYLWIIHSILGTWIFLTLGIRKTAKMLLQDLQDQRLRTYFFDELYTLWLDLKNLTEDLGTAFSSTYIYYLTYMFILMMGTSYSLFISIATPDAGTNYGYLGCVLMTSTFFGVIADSAHRTTLQVGAAFNNVLQQLLQNEKDPAMKRDMKWFIQTLALNPPVITLSGYFTLNREFNVSMLGTLVTYIVVVLQFRATSAGKTSPSTNGN